MFAWARQLLGWLAFRLRILATPARRARIWVPVGLRVATLGRTWRATAAAAGGATCAGAGAWTPRASSASTNAVPPAVRPVVWMNSRRETFRGVIEVSPLDGTARMGPI